MASDTRRGAPAADAPDTAQASAVAPAVADGGGPLGRRIADIRARQGDSVPLADVAAVVQSLLESLTGDLGAEDLRLYQEVEKLARYIRAARAEIAAVNPTDIREEFLPTATDELDAIVQATETATGEIMDATEAMDDLGASLAGATPPDPVAASRVLQDATTRIYEACSFQDITGQRITKVVRMLKSIEARVDALVRVFEPEAGASRQASSQPVPADPATLQAAGNHGRTRAAAAGDKAGDDALLNGPQDGGEAMAQDDIDALLSSFD